MGDDRGGKTEGEGEREQSEIQNEIYGIHGNTQNQEFITIMEFEAKFRTEFLKHKYRIEFKFKLIEEYSA